MNLALHSPRLGGVLLALSIAACALVPAEPALAVPGSGKFVVHTLPVGAGNCQLVECPWQDKLIVMDCGSRGLGDRGWSADEVGQFVDGLIGPKTSVTVAVSHPDSDHYNYLEQVLSTAHVKTFVLAQQLGNYHVDFQEWVRDEVQAENGQLITWNGPYTSAAVEPSLSCAQPQGNGWQIDVPGYVVVVNAGTTRNDSSMVVAMQYGQFQTVFTGDMTGATQAAIPQNLPVNLAATQFITGAHHGAWTHGSNQQSWADATRPQLVAFSSGTRHNHPRCEAVDTYLRVGTVLTNMPNHTYQCSWNGQYVQRQGTDGVLVTNSNGRISVTGNTDGTFNVFAGAAHPVGVGISSHSVTGARAADAR